VIFIIGNIAGVIIWIQVAVDGGGIVIPHTKESVTVVVQGPFQRAQPAVYRGIRPDLEGYLFPIGAAGLAQYLPGEIILVEVDAGTAPDGII